jgi:hypothetical protein
MMADYRRHYAVQPVVVILPAAGSPKEIRRERPPRYPQDRRPPWRPADAIPRPDPVRLKQLAEAFRRDFRRQIEAVGAMRMRLAA